MQKQLQCGYILSHVWESLGEEIPNILLGLSYFWIDFSFKSYPLKDSILNVVSNMLSRGLPTLPSLFIEDHFVNRFGTAIKETSLNTGNILYKTTKLFDQNINEIKNAFYVIEPRFTGEKIFKANEYEKIFFNKTLTRYFHPSVMQLIEAQRPLNNIIENGGGDLWKSSRIKFTNQRVDYSIEFPEGNGFSGVVIEVDGPQHQDQSQKKLDKNRDEAIRSIGWEPTIRIRTHELPELDKNTINLFEDIFSKPYFSIIKENYNNPIWNRKHGADALCIALSPFGIARIQKTMLFLMSTGALNFHKKTWRIAVIERDVPCASIAVKDLQEIFENIFILEGRNRHLPKIELSIFVSEEFTKCRLDDTPFQLINDFNKKTETEIFDAIIDVSLLQRDPIDLFADFPLSVISKYVKIWSVKSQNSKRIVQSSDSVKYKISKNNKASLEYFLRNLFRKSNFRDGQIEILERTLTKRNVIALLPTGAGKSLTYQLSVLLQPGIALIIDPLKSLMRDQNDNMKTIGIDSTVFINSSLTPSERNRVSKKMAKGHFQFVFISPERLQIAEFREYLASMSETKFSYCIIDEAHCVSEWGHDFRTAYLRVGANARKYCRTSNDEELTIIGLTGTASFDVLADVQRELDIAEKTSIITPSKYKRDELKFKIIKVGEEITVSNNYRRKRSVAQSKIYFLFKLFEKIPSEKWELNKNYKSISDFFPRETSEKNSGLIFCPHVNGVFGVKNVYKYLAEKYKELEPLMDIYAGKLEEDDNVNLEEIQNNFKRDSIALLIATKAFGLGIDKANIRFTVHFNMPQSIESFYQEAGRAGRDRKTAYCYILYSPVSIKENGKIISMDKSLMLTFYRNAFRGIKKEKSIIWELLKEISFEAHYVNPEMVQVFNRIDSSIQFSLWPKENPRRLYIKKSDNKYEYGFIDLINLKVTANKNTNDKESEANRNNFLKKTLNNLIEKCPTNLSLLNWIINNKEPWSEPGIEELLKEMEIGEQKEVVIGFRNDRLQRIKDYLIKSDIRWNSISIREAVQYSFDANAFMSKLESLFYKYHRKKYLLGSQQRQVITSWFYQIRESSDTFKAIYRLSIIGVISDYEVDYNSKDIIAIINKEKEEKYVENLINYIGRYISVEEKKGLAEKIYLSKGNTIIQKCSGYLIDFIYSKIASKRLEAINVMETAIRAGLEKGKFEEFIDTYFDSRFTPKLREYLYDYSLETVWRFMAETGGEPDSLNHLRGACDRLLVENPDNAAFLLLRSFTRFLIPALNKSEALDDFHKGWKLFIKKQNWSRDKYLKNMSLYYSHLTSYDSSLKYYLDIEILNEHKNWLNKFNKGFLV